ncbi:MAG: hypothetical protein ACRC8A_04160 [Microcoleaceae cyanobacterium]
MHPLNLRTFSLALVLNLLTSLAPGAVLPTRSEPTLLAQVLSDPKSQAAQLIQQGNQQLQTSQYREASNPTNAPSHSIGKWAILQRRGCANATAKLTH